MIYLNYLRNKLMPYIESLISFPLLLILILMILLCCLVSLSFLVMCLF